MNLSEKRQKLRELQLHREQRLLKMQCATFEQIRDAPQSQQSEEFVLFDIPPQAKLETYSKAVQTETATTAPPQIDTLLSDSVEYVESSPNIVQQTAQFFSDVDVVNCTAIDIAVSSRSALFAVAYSKPESDKFCVVIVWNLVTGYAEHKYKCPSQVNCLLFEGNLYGGTSCGQIFVWGDDTKCAMAHSHGIIGIVSTPQLISVSLEGMLYFWGLEISRPQSNICLENNLTCVSSISNRIIAGTDNGFIITVCGHSTKTYEAGDYVIAIKCSSVGKDIFVCSLTEDWTMQLWNWATEMKPIFVYDTQEKQLDICWSPSLILLASLGATGTISFWKTTDSAPIFVHDAPNAVKICFSAGGSELIVANADGSLFLIPASID